MTIGSFFEKNKIFIGIIMAAFIIGGFIYFSGQKSQPAPVEVEIEAEETETKADEEKNLIIDQYHEISKEADALKDQGKYAEAIVKYKEALDLVKYRAFIWNSKEDFYETYGNLSEEEKTDRASDFTTFGNRAATTHYSLSFAYRDAELANNLQNAIDSAKQAVEEIDKVILLGEIQDEINPDRFKFSEDLAITRKASYLSQLGDLYRLYGALDLSLKAHKEAIELEPDNAGYYVWLGVAYAANGQYTLAKQQWRKALELDPDNADASKFLETL